MEFYSSAAVASAISFSLGIIVPIFNAAFIPNYKVRLAVNVAAMSLSLLLCGGIGTLFSTSPMVKSCPRVLLEAGWLWSLPFAKGTTVSCLSDHRTDHPSMVSVLWNLEYCLQSQSDPDEPKMVVEQKANDVYAMHTELLTVAEKGKESEEHTMLRLLTEGY
ncbi:hypothetical protein H5410_058017 [Solanum commersonii]|uniref:Uncharacterized protein n=1 Tax=Solanum commersonii TaxID=4109 RepID=A0A9J5WPI3_SOLCO|nr:hypothetical protein H5410_058017 [Solanum commersonii]